MIIPHEAFRHVEGKVKEHLEDDYPSVRTSNRWIRVRAYGVSDSSMEKLATELEAEGWKVNWWTQKGEGTMKVTKQGVEWPTQKDNVQ